MLRVSTRHLRMLRLLCGYVIFVTVVENLVLMFRFGGSGLQYSLVWRNINGSFSSKESRAVSPKGMLEEVTNRPTVDEEDDHPPMDVTPSVKNGVGFQSYSPPVKPAPLTPSERLFYRRRDTKVNPYKHDFILPGDHICDDQTEIVVIVHSSVPFTERRRAIRRTWGSVVNGGRWPHNRTIDVNIKLAFIFGLHKDPSWNAHLRRENEELKDVIQGDFEDTYVNMTLKSLLGLKWVVEYCPSVEYLLKSDDDMFINIPYLLDTLRARNMRRSIMGPLCLGSPVYRKGKWGIKKEEFPFPRYPPYEAGSAYIITGDVIAELFETSEYVPAIFIDDVYVTGILGRIIGLDHARQTGFAFWPTPAPSPCQIITNEIITGHKMKEKRLIEFWMKLKAVNPASCKTIRSVARGPKIKATSHKSNMITRILKQSTSSNS